MRRLRRSVYRHKNKWMVRMTSMALVAVLAAGAQTAGVQQVYAAEQEQSESEKETAKKEIAVFLDGKSGDDLQNGATADHAVKTWKRAVELVKETKANVIYVSETIRVEASAEWKLKGFVIKGAKGFKGPLISVEKKAVLTIYGQEFKEDEISVGTEAELIVHKELPKEPDTEETDTEETDTEKSAEDTDSDDKLPEKKEENPVQPEGADTENKQQQSPEESEEKVPSKEQPSSGSGDMTSEQQPEEQPQVPEDTDSEQQPEEQPQEPEKADGEQLPEETLSPEEQQALQNLALAEQAAASIEESISQAEVGDIYQLVDATKEFEALALEVQELIPQNVKDDLTAAQEASKEILLNCNGLKVTGEFLPWHVQFIAELRTDGALTEQQDVRTLLSSYDLKLWDLMTDTEYKIPEGQKVTVTMKAPDMGLYQQLIIVHTLEDGSKEYITPVIDGDWLSFETSSFSPFDVAGNKVIVGIQFPKENSTGSQSSSGSLVSGSTGNRNTTGTSSSRKNSSSSSKKNSASNPSSAKKRNSAPKTGDAAVIFPYALSAGAAAIGAVTARGKKKKEEEE
ncbi:MAG: hypothetical protein ACOYBL_01970 [Lachnospiraceae bacterium]|jgi:hypothetical protein